jgi:hypothetical protein
VRFTLDFGPALGGKFTAAPVATFLDPFIRDTLANLLVWPQVKEGGWGVQAQSYLWEWKCVLVRVRHAQN